VEFVVGFLVGFVGLWLVSAAFTPLAVGLLVVMIASSAAGSLQRGLLRLMRGRLCRWARFWGLWRWGFSSWRLLSCWVGGGVVSAACRQSRRPAWVCGGVGVVGEVRRWADGVGLVAAFGVGLVSGVFGVGGGWALVPVFNLVMGLPLKVACSEATIALGDAAAAATYLSAGFLVSTQVGVALGAFLGARVAAFVKARVVRLVVLGVLLLAAANLLAP